MAIRRPDTPLAATVFNNAQEPQKTPQQKRDSLIAVRKAKLEAITSSKKNELATKKAKLDSILAEKRKETAILTKQKDSVSKVKMEGLQKRFNARAESLGMTPKQYSRKLEKDKRKPDIPSSIPDYKQRSGGRNPCPGNVCKK